MVGLIEPIVIEKGVYQGDLLSPLLFNIIVDKIVKGLSELPKMGHKEIDVICYTDNVILLSNNEDNLQCLLHCFDQLVGILNMKLSSDKMKTMTLAKEPIRCKLATTNKIIE